MASLGSGVRVKHKGQGSQLAHRNDRGSRSRCRLLRVCKTCRTPRRSSGDSAAWLGMWVCALLAGRSAGHPAIDGVSAGVGVCIACRAQRRSSGDRRRKRCYPRRPAAAMDNYKRLAVERAGTRGGPASSDALEE